MVSVSELTKSIKFLLEDEFSQITVIGEISNFKAHNSGHWYFNLKDAEATICCTMWRGFNNLVYFSPEDGMKIVINGKLTVYPPRGNYQIDIRSMKPAGAGELQAAFEKLKQKLLAAGYFDLENKKEIPVIPKKIGLVTAVDGAAVKDMISVAERRFPLVHLVVFPARVQGVGAAGSIVHAIEQLNLEASVDVIILARGGGTIEDLWAFNEEIVARAIFNSDIPIITGIGHETDFTIADFTADLRAATPTAAMELATPDKDDFIAFIREFLYTSNSAVTELFDESRDRINSALKSYGFRKPTELIKQNSQTLDNLIYRIQNSFEAKMLMKRNQLALLKKSVDAHDIQSSLKKGFVLVKQDSKFIVRSKKFVADQPADLIFYDGSEKIISYNN
jgi:exodeoxyribonuclease VII large subunit